MPYTVNNLSVLERNAMHFPQRNSLLFFFLIHILDSLFSLCLRWLKTVSSTFQDVDFDGSLLPLFMNCCYNHGIKNCPITGEHVVTIFVTQ